MVVTSGIKGTKNKEFTYIDLFSGAGGASLGLKKAGLRGVWAIDLDENAVETYRTNIGEHVVCADIRDIDTSELPTCDVLVGGFPCQPFSISGLQGGFSDRDGDLFYQCARFIHDLSPKVFMLENVPGFLRLKKGIFHKKAIQVLKSLGYHVEWKLLNAADYGIPQVRERLIIIGNKLGYKNTFPDPDGHKISVKEAIEDIRLNMSKFLNNDPMKHTDRIKRRFSAVRPGETARDAMDRDPSLGTAKISRQCYRRLIPDEPAPTVVANFVTTTIHYSEDRNITAREAARLQSFPDTFEFKGLRTRMSWQSGLSQYEQIGNAIPPTLAYRLGKSIIAVLEKNTKRLSEEELLDNQSEQLQLFDVENEYTTTAPSQITKKIGNRGRKSRFESIYKELEALEANETLTLPFEIPDEFFVFLEGAMRRRGIKYELLKNSGKEKIVRKI